MHALKMQPFVPPVQQTQGRKNVEYSLLIIGAQGVGKYCLHHQFVYACFPSIRDPFFDSETPQMLWKADGNDKIAFQIQPTRMDISRVGDVANSQHLYPNTRLPVDLYRLTDSNGMMLVYNITSRSSFAALKQFVEARIQDSASSTVDPKVLCIVGNKLDCSRDKRKILCLEGEALARKLGCPFLECSAKDQKGLEKVRSAMIKSMESQQSQLQTTQTQRERVTQNARISTLSSPSLIRRLSGGAMSRPDAPYNPGPNDPNRIALPAQHRQHPNRAIRHSGRYMGLKATSLSSEDRIEEEDEETESDEISRSSSQQSSNPSTTSKQSGITITPPSNASSIRTSFNHRLTMEKLPPPAIISLSPMNEKPMDPRDVIRSPSRLSSYVEASADRPKLVDGSTTPPANATSLRTLFQYRLAPKKESDDKKQKEVNQPTYIKSSHSSAASSRVQSPQSSSRIQSPEPLVHVPSPHFYSASLPIQPLRLLELEFPEPLSPTSEEKRKLEVERAKLEEEREQLKQEMRELEEQQLKLDERKRIDKERREIDEERKKIVEERKKIEEERRNLEEAKRKIEEEDATWRYQVEHFREDIGHNPSNLLQEQSQQALLAAGFQDIARREESRRQQQQQLQQERQQNLQLKSGQTSPSSEYSLQQASPTQHLATSVALEIGTMQSYGHFDHQQERSTTSSKASFHPNQQENSTQPPKSPEPVSANSSKPLERISSPTKSPSPDISLTFRRRLQKRPFLNLQPTPKPPKDQQEMLQFLNNELGISIPQIPNKSSMRSATTLLLPPVGNAKAIEEERMVIETAKAEAKPKLPFPGRYI